MRIHKTSREHVEFRFWKKLIPDEKFCLEEAHAARKRGVEARIAPEGRSLRGSFRQRLISSRLRCGAAKPLWNFVVYSFYTSFPASNPCLARRLDQATTPPSSAWGFFPLFQVCRLTTMCRLCASVATLLEPEINDPCSTYTDNFVFPAFFSSIFPPFFCYDLKFWQSVGI